MADLSNDGMYRVVFVPGGFANKSAPTLAEITGGIRVDGRMTPTGLTRTPTTNNKDTSKLNSKFTTHATGRVDYSLSIECVREVGDTTGVEAALTLGAAGDLLITDDKDSATAFATGDKAEVYPVQCEEPVKSSPAANEDQKITFGFAMTADPARDAIVA